ncbi:MAG TPA: hypothetical protein VFC03_13175, partial [Acidimicrobiales bacterium]|nr:hypothetical protein [Acidimicrobiales bacterium]
TLWPSIAAAAAMLGHSVLPSRRDIARAIDPDRTGHPLPGGQLTDAAALCRTDSDALTTRAEQLYTDLVHRAAHGDTLPDDHAAGVVGVAGDGAVEGDVGQGAVAGAVGGHGQDGADGRGVRVRGAPDEPGEVRCGGWCPVGGGVADGECGDVVADGG